MSNKEILAELKTNYEYLYDIRENSYEQLNEKELKKLEQAGELIDEVYFDFWNRLFASTEDLAIPKQYQTTEETGEIILIGNSPSADYIIKSKNGSFDENIITCEDLGYYWYQDRENL